MTPVDQVAATRRDFGQENRAGQIGGKNRGLMEIPAAVIGDGGNLDDFEGKLSRIGVENGENSRDVEFKDTVRVNLVPLVDRTRLKPFVQPESSGMADGCKSDSVSVNDGPSPASNYAKKYHPGLGKALNFRQHAVV